MATPQNSTSGSRTAYSEDTGAVEEKGRQIGHKVDAAAGRIQSGFEAKTSKALHRLEETGVQVKEKYAATKGKVLKSAQENRVKLAQQVQENPVKTLLYAFGVGAFVGLLIRNSRKNHD